MLSVVIMTVTGFTFLAVLYIYFTRQKYTTIDAFLTARGTLGTWATSATVFATIMGAWILFSPAESGTWGGITAFAGYAVAQALAIMAFAVFGPRLRYIAPHGTSLMEFVYYRFGKPMYVLTLLVAVFYMAVFLSAELTGIALGLNMILGIPLWLTASLIGGSTLIYTAYGGIRGSLFTDTLQAIIILPTLLIAFIASITAFGGLRGIAVSLQEIDPSLLSIGHRGGWEFALTLVIAVVAANLFHQGFWSRVYACRDTAGVRKSFLLSGVIIVPVVMLAGSFGLMAVAGDMLEVPSAALFEVVMQVGSSWVIIVVLLLALALVMSSADSSINGMAAVFTVDIARFSPGLSSLSLRFWARVLTAMICVIVITIASQGYSVLYLFLAADLACAGAVFPTFYGLYSNRLTGKAAFFSALAGIVAGAFFFPDPSFTRGNLLFSFMVALLLPAVISLLSSSLSGKTIDLSSLQEKVSDIKVDT